MECSVRHTICFKEYFLIILSAVVISLIIFQIAAYADKNDVDIDNPSEKIHITSDRLILNRDEESAEFKGNVKATQGKTVITSNSLKIYYSNGTDRKKKSGSKEGAIKKIYATGNVKIIMDDKIAFAQQAVYTSENSILVLSGGGSKIISNNDSVTADKITLYRKEGRIIIEGGEKKRVEAILFPEKENR